MKKAAGEGYATATDLADWLVRTLKMPFRDAHHVTGRVVALAEEKGVPLHRLALADMQAVEPQITDDVFTVLSVDQFGEEPRQLRRHGAEKRAGAGEALVEETRQGARLTWQSQKWVGSRVAPIPKPRPKGCPCRSSTC